MPRDPAVYLEDILEAIERIREYAAGMKLESFSADRKSVDAILFNLQTIGEAAKGVPEGLRSLAPEVDWRKVAGLRDLIAHAYFQVDLEIVWDVVESKLDILESSVRRILAVM